MTCVVVGIDGSAYSKAALRFAADEAKLRRAELRVVTAWEVPRSVYPAVYYLPSLDPETVAEYARQQAQLEIDEIPPAIGCSSRSHEDAVIGVESRGSRAL